MKKLITTLLITTIAQLASANSGSQINLKLENSYLDIADTLATSKNDNGPCGEVEAYTTEIVEAVVKARQYFDNNWEYNEQTGRKFVITAPTTKALGTTLKLKEIMNMLDLEDPKTFEHSLNRVIMWGPAPGAYGNMTSIKFGANNTAVVAELELLDQEPYYKWNETPAQFFVFKRNQKLLVEIKTATGSKEYNLEQNYGNGVWDQMWQMVPADQPDASPWTHGYVDYPSECEA